MTAAPFMLPGGLPGPDGLCRDVRFRRLTGRVELALADPDGASLPARVTAALVAAVEELAGAPATVERVRALCVDDRRFLMHQLSATLGIRAVWLQSRCRGCERVFEVRIEPATLPVKPAGEGFPEASGPGGLRVRVPNGGDQEAVAWLAPEDAATALAARCVVTGDGDVAAVETLAESVSPEVVREISTSCPECGRDAAVPVDPYTCLQGATDRLEDDVHALARAYGWSEDETLALPTHRRRRYVERVQDAG